MYLCIYVFVYLCICVFMYVCVYVFMCLCLFVLRGHGRRGAPRPPRAEGSCRRCRRRRPSRPRTCAGGRAGVRTCVRAYVQYNTIQYIHFCLFATYCRTRVRAPAQYNTIQYNTIQCIHTIRYDTIQYNIIQYKHTYILLPPERLLRTLIRVAVHGRTRGHQPASRQPRASARRSKRGGATHAGGEHAPPPPPVGPRRRTNAQPRQALEVRIRIYTHTHTYIHTYVRTYVRTYIHTYIHTYYCSLLFRAPGNLLLRASFCTPLPRVIGPLLACVP